MRTEPPRRKWRRVACALAVASSVLAGLVGVTVTRAAEASVPADTTAAPVPAYWLAGADGGVFSFGGAPWHGSAVGAGLSWPVVAMAATPDSDGYWLTAADGGVFSFGDAAFYGSLGGVALNEPLVGMAATPTGRGYWLVAADGGVFSFGDARFYGSTGGLPLNAPVVGMAATPTGRGYWLVAMDGGVFSFGDAAFYGSAGGLPLNAPVVGMAASPTGKGYWLAALDGGVFTYGDAGFFGSAGSLRLNEPVTGMASTPTGRGYWLVASDGGVFTYGDAPYRGSAVSMDLAAPVVAIVAARSLDPYRPGATGYDISWPQCGSPLPPAPVGLAVVGVTDGKAFGHNPCLATEAAWGRPAGLTLYTMLNSPSVNQPEMGATGSAGTCAVGDASCLAYNYGYAAVLDAVAYASSQGATSPMWWLDVEMPAGTSGAHWGTDLVANARVVAGAIAAVTARGFQAGVYSNSYQWPLIVGSYAPPVPMWQARPDASDSPTVGRTWCTTGTFTTGPVWLVQYGVATYDMDLAC